MIYLDRTRYRQRLLPLGLILTLSLGLALVLWQSLATTPQLLYANTLCVKPGGGDGCLASINTALTLAHENDTIRVAAGTYQENVFISQTLTLQGGWNLDFSRRNIDIFSTTITPLDNNQSVVTIQGEFGDTSAVSPTLDGFVIRDGRADLGSNHGGGLSIRDSNAVIISNTIRNNVAFFLGGGVWVQRGAPLFQNNQVMDNLTVGLGQQAYGGGIQLENTPATLLGNVIVGNVVSGTQAYGGGLQISSTGSGQATLRQNQFISNTALASPGAALADFGFGGGIAVNGGQALLTNNIVISNTAATAGGGIHISGHFADCCALTEQDNLIQFNTAVQGGGIFIGGLANNCCRYSGLNSRIQNNMATTGGGLFNDAQYATLEGALVFSNTVGTDGGGLYIQAGGIFSSTSSAIIANVAGGDGGAIYNAGVISVSNTTVSSNSANGMGGGIANFDLINMVNATVATNTSSEGAGFLNAKTVNVKNSLIALNMGDNCLGGLASQGHNLEDGGTCTLGQPSDMSNTAPSMKQLAVYGGSTPTHALNDNSPAIDAGDNTACPLSDQRGEPRPVDGDGDGTAICDIGAYEYGATRFWLYLPTVTVTQ